MFAVTDLVITDMKMNKLRGAISEILSVICPEGSEIDCHLQDTPRRYAKALLELTTAEPFDFTVFPNDKGYDEMVTVFNIPFASLCPHHLLPYMGHAYVGYLPEAHIVGLSKIPRAVQSLAKGLMTQEDLTSKIAELLEATLNPKGVGVVLEATHTCMAIRGVKVADHKTVTSAMRGAFLDPGKQARSEFMNLILQGRK